MCLGDLWELPEHQDRNFANIKSETTAAAQQALLEMKRTGL